MTQDRSRAKLREDETQCTIDDASSRKNGHRPESSTFIKAILDTARSSEKIITLETSAKNSYGITSTRKHIIDKVHYISVITEIDGIPLNPMPKNEQFFQRLGRLSQGTVFNVVVQPRDLVKIAQAKAQTLQQLQS
uniref:Uncharacterized protein n=1 Tax=Ditylenchus dipsaci TaxID=166011 RepID=A0A915EI69_9BILA